MNAKLVLAVALATLAPATAVASPLDATQVVEGHTVFVNLTPAGSDLAAIAGSVQCQVLWFNDQVLFRVPAGTSGICGDANFVYAYPANAPDPRDNPTLRPTGQVWEFTDPNGAGWRVAEYSYKHVQVIVNQNLDLPDFIGENITLEQFEYTTWIVEAGPSVRDPTIDQDYNFVLLVDTSKILLTENNGVVHEGDADSVLEGNSHRTTYRSHAHDKSWVTLGLGGPPPMWY